MQKPTPSLPLGTSRLLIREFTPADEDALAALYSDARVTRHMLFGPRTATGTKRHLTGILRRQTDAARDSWELAVDDQHGGRLIGACDLALVSREEAEIGYLLSPSYWGSGLGTEIATAMLGMAFEQLAVLRVQSTVEVHNTRSLRVLDKAGMRWEATLRRHARTRGKWWDVHLYAVGREDWLQACA